MTDGGTITITPKGRPAFVAESLSDQKRRYKSALILLVPGAWPSGVQRVLGRFIP